jgi:tetratricopeptide (TPR) repeat protein
VGNPFENLDPAAALLERTGHNAEAIEFLEQLVKASPWEPGYRLRLARAKIAAGQDLVSLQNALTAVASGPDVSYGVRTQAALALAGMGGPVELGSAELHLLAGGTTQISDSAADQPFFYDARLKAAQRSADAQIKVQLLGSALADAPARDDARIRLFLTAAGLHSDEFACGVIEPLIRQQFLRSVSPVASRENEIIRETDNDSGEQNVPGQLDSPFKLLVAQQAQVARTLGDLMIRLNRLDDALRYLRVAQKLETAPAPGKEISSAITEVSVRLRRQRLNAARQPILHEALEQDRLVRPRLLARSAPPAKGGTKE